MCREWIQLLTIPPYRLNEPMLGFLRRAGWDSAQQTTSKTISEFLLFQCKPESKSIYLWKNNSHYWTGQFPGWMKSNFRSLVLSPLPGNTLHRYTSYVDTQCYNKKRGWYIHVHNKPNVPNWSDFLFLYFPGCNPKHNYFRNELSDSYPGDSKPSNLSGQVSKCGGVCVKSSNRMTVLEMADRHWHALAVQRGGSWPDEGEQLSGNPVRVGSVKILKRKLNFSFSFQKKSTWCHARWTWKEAVPRVFLSAAEMVTTWPISHTCHL